MVSRSSLLDALPPSSNDPFFLSRLERGVLMQAAMSSHPQHSPGRGATVGSASPPPPTFLYQRSDREWQRLLADEQERSSKLASANSVLRETQQYLVEKCSAMSHTLTARIAELEQELQRHSREPQADVSLIREHIAQVQQLTTRLDLKTAECDLLKAELAEARKNEASLMSHVDALNSALEKMVSREEERQRSERAASQRALSKIRDLQSAASMTFGDHPHDTATGSYDTTVAEGSSCDGKSVPPGAVSAIMPMIEAIEQLNARVAEATAAGQQAARSQLSRDAADAATPQSGQPLSGGRRGLPSAGHDGLTLEEVSRGVRAALQNAAIALHDAELDTIGDYRRLRQEDPTAVIANSAHNGRVVLLNDAVQLLLDKVNVVEQENRALSLQVERLQSHTMQHARETMQVELDAAAEWRNRLNEAVEASETWRRLALEGKESNRAATDSRQAPAAAPQPPTPPPTPTAYSPPPSSGPSSSARRALWEPRPVDANTVLLAAQRQQDPAAYPLVASTPAPVGVVQSSRLPNPMLLSSPVPRPFASLVQTPKPLAIPSSDSSATSSVLQPGDQDRHAATTEVAPLFQAQVSALAAVPIAPKPLSVNRTAVPPSLPASANDTAANAPVATPVAPLSVLAPEAEAHVAAPTRAAPKKLMPLKKPLQPGLAAASSSSGGHDTASIPPTSEHMAGASEPAEDAAVINREAGAAPHAGADENAAPLPTATPPRKLMLLRPPTAVAASVSLSLEEPSSNLPAAPTAAAPKKLMLLKSSALAPKLVAPVVKAELPAADATVNEANDGTVTVPPPHSMASDEPPVSGSRAPPAPAAPKRLLLLAKRPVLAVAVGPAALLPAQPAATSPATSTSQPAEAMTPAGTTEAESTGDVSAAAPPAAVAPKKLMLLKRPTAVPSDGAVVAAPLPGAPKKLVLLKKPPAPTSS
mgnify:CR=1 FL=1